MVTIVKAKEWFLLLCLGFCWPALAESPYPFVSENFKVPQVLETKRFRLRMLTVNDLVKDYEAVMSSKEHLQKLFGTDWPEGLTLEQDLIDLGWHQREFQARTSFAYTVVSLDESKVLGCVYINPTRKVGYDAEVMLWARQSELKSGLQEELKAVVKNWLKQKWPFKNPAFPILEIDLMTWAKTPETKR